MLIYLDPEDREELEALSKRGGAPMSELVRRALNEYLKREKARSKKS